MTRDETMVKLLALGPLTREDIHQVTGWQYMDVVGSLAVLGTARRIEQVQDGGRRKFMLAASTPWPFAACTRSR